MKEAYCSGGCQRSFLSPKVKWWKCFNYDISWRVTLKDLIFSFTPTCPSVPFKSVTRLMMLVALLLWRWSTIFWCTLVQISWLCLLLLNSLKCWLHCVKPQVGSCSHYCKTFWRLLVKSWVMSVFQFLFGLVSGFCLQWRELAGLFLRSPCDQTMSNWTQGAVEQLPAETPESKST